MAGAVALRQFRQRCLPAPGYAGRMVRHHYPIESNLFVNAHRSQHIYVAVVNERLIELVRGIPPNVSEMGIADLLLFAEAPDGFVDILSHFRHRTLAEVHAAEM